jgi:hypothetical protein
MAQQSEVINPFQVWSEKGSDWYRTYSGKTGEEDYCDCTCTKCFRFFPRPRRHYCTSVPPDGIININGGSPRRLRDLACRMARAANTEGRYDGGIFGPNSWNGSPTSVISEAFFFVMIKDGRPVSYVIYDKLKEGLHIVHHTFTVPYERHKGHMVELLRFSLEQIGETASTILHRAPIKESMLNLWQTKFGVNTKDRSFHRYWERFSKTTDQQEKRNVR